MEGLVFVAIALALGAFLVLGYLADKKRREELMRFALSKQWRYDAEDPSLVVFAQGPPFGQGDSQRARNVLHGSASGFDMVAFDYSYETHSTDAKGNRTTTTHRYSVAGLRLPAYLPTLQVTGESVFHKAAALLGFDDIELESDEFNQRFHVSAGDRKFACDVLTPRTMQTLLTCPQTSWRIEGPLILSWESGRLTPVDLLGRLSTLSAVVAGVPSFIWRDHGVPDAGDPTTGRPAS
ncbi:MAG: hypothetical protein QOJ92_370 [Frankiales bacterium]|nr:hypothetical protein [Frankiales bacterium]